MYVMSSEDGVAQELGTQEGNRFGPLLLCCARPGLTAAAVGYTAAAPCLRVTPQQGKMKKMKRVVAIESK